MLKDKTAFPPLEMCTLNQLSFYSFDLFICFQAAQHDPVELN